MPDKIKKIPSDISSIKVAVIYFVLGALWILFSDRAVSSLFDSEESLTMAQTYKGWFYVVMTAILVYALVERALRKQKKLEKHLYEQQKLEAIGVLSSGIVHEVKSPVTVIKNYATLIKEEATESSSSYELAVSIEQEADKVMKIVNGLLVFTHKDQPESPDRADTAKLVNEAILLVKNLMLKDHIVVENDIPDNIPDIMCRPIQVQQVMLNLLTNARDALNTQYPTEDDAKVIIISAEKIRRDGKDFVNISFQDFGSGIKPEIINHIFEPFFSTKKSGAGTGLGLSISYGIVKEHDGYIEVESEPGKGATFNLYFPVAV